MDRKSKNDTWKIKDVMKYARMRYNLAEPNNEITEADRTSQERKVRRTAEKNFTLKKRKDGSNIYEFDEIQAKYLIDSLLKDYFTPLGNSILIKNKNFQEDNRLNESVTNSLINCDFQDDYEYDSTPSESEINSAIDRLMLRAIFSSFYEFDEEQYRHDYIKRAHLINDTDMIEPYLDGYSEVNNKLKDPINYYCKKKRV